MTKHESVLLKESIRGLAIQQQGIYVDGTLGRGGHSKEILKHIAQGRLYAFDRDIHAIEESNKQLATSGSNVTLIHANFSRLKDELAMYSIDKIDGMLLDLGVSSPQVDEANRGFSYRLDAPLDMRMDQRQKRSAYEIINEWEYHELVRIFYQYGEESYAKHIARKIEKARIENPIETTFALVDVIKSALPSKVLHKKGHPAKKVFQAIRIAVNDELKELEIVLKDALSMLKVNGRLCVISFQSLEDRMVKETFARASTPQQVEKRIPILPKDIEKASFALVNKKVIVPRSEEVIANHRSHSAKLRIIERIR